MVEALPNDHVARERALNTTRSFIVQAPAGSGKTALLTRRFLRLLSIVDAPEQILAITFTRKAADEMRVRVLTALREANAGTPISGAFAEALRHDAQRALARDQSMEWRLLDSPSRLQILTVDALNTRLVASRPLAAGQIGQSLINTDLRTRLLDAAADATLEWLTEQDDTGAAIGRAFARMDSDTSVWRRQIVSMLQSRDKWLPLVVESLAQPESRLRQTSESLLQQLIQGMLRGVNSLLTPVSFSELFELLAIAHGNLAEQGSFFKFPETVEAARVDPQFWRFAADTLLTSANSPDWRKRVNKTNGFVKEDRDSLARIKALIEELASVDGLKSALQSVRALPATSYDDDQWALIVCMLKALRVASAEYVRLMNQHGVFDYPELAARALAALGDEQTVTDLALQYDYRLQHILVDEMQDTSARQYRLLERLTAGWQPSDGRTLFCVGDPMQSIYRFRGAEVSLFLRAWTSGIGDVALEPVSLNTNFRSQRPLVDWVNQTFRQVLGEYSDAMDESVAHAPSEPAPMATDSGAVTWHCHAGSAADEAAQAVAQVQALLEERTSTIGIVGRTRHALTPTLEALEAAGIAFESVDMERLTERAEVQDLLTLTRALEMPDDDIAWLGCLRGPWCGLSLAQLDAMMRQVTAPEMSMRMRVEAALVAEVWPTDAAHKVRTFLDKVTGVERLAATVSLRERVERLWGALGIPASLPSTLELAAAYAYLDALEELEEGGRLRNPALLEKLLGDRRVTGGQPGARVTVMTIFSSKGLEFDHVIMPGMAVTSRRDSTPPLRMEVQDSDSGSGIIFAAADDRNAQDKDPLGALLATLESRRSYNELKRLLYVATTRARRTLQLFARAERNQKGDQWCTPASDTLLRPLWHDVKPLLPEPSDAAADASQEPAERVFAAPLHSRFSDEWQSPAAPRRSTLEAATGEQTEDEYPGTDTVRARAVGIVVHEWLRALAGTVTPEQTYESMSDTPRRSRDLLRQLGIRAGDLDIAVGEVHALVRSALESAEGQWIVGSATPGSAAEFALWTRTDTGPRQVIIDRLARDPQGTLWIIDYKTARNEDGDLDAFFKAEVERYRGQVQRYGRALAGLPAFAADRSSMQLGLYFVAYGKLVTVPTAA